MVIFIYADFSSFKMVKPMKHKSVALAMLKEYKRGVADANKLARKVL